MTATPAGSNFPAVVGINFGNSYASISVLSKDGSPICIANEDGERQIATALSFFGEEEYIGNQALPQLVKNSSNTITGFRNLLGQSVSKAASVKRNAAPVINHNNSAAFTVQVLEPTPTPPALLQPTPRGSTVVTPLQSPPPELAEPTYVSKTLTVSEVTTVIIQSLVQSAADFLGKPIEGAVITVPAHFTPEARAALQASAESAGVKVLQLLEDPAAAAVAYSTLSSPAETDRTSLILDLGASGLDLTLLSTKQGLFHSIASSHTPHIGGDAIDDKLVAYFIKEFTKKTKIALSPTSKDPADVRAVTKLHLAVEHTKRTLSASPGAATCSVESLKDGHDLHGTINRLRFDIEMKSIYAAVSHAVKALLESAEVDLVQLDEVILVGASTLLPGLTSQLSLTLHESTEIRTDIDPSQVLSRGAVVQAALLASLSPNDPLVAAFQTTSSVLESLVTSKPVGLYFPEDNGDGIVLDQWLPVIAAETPLPARRTISFNIQLAEKEGSQRVGFEVWEVKETVSIERIKPTVDEDEEEDEEVEEEEIREKSIEKETFLAALSVDVVGFRGGKKKKGPLQATVVVTLVVTADRHVEIIAQEDGHEKSTKVVRI